MAVSVAVMPALAGAAQFGPTAPAGLGGGGHALVTDDPSAGADDAAKRSLTRWRDGNDAGKAMPSDASKNGPVQLTARAVGSGWLPTSDLGDSPGAKSCGRGGLATPYPGASGAASPFDNPCQPPGLWPASAGLPQDLRSCCDGTGTDFLLMPGLARYFSAQDGAQDGAQHFSAQGDAAQSVLAQTGKIAAAEPEPPSVALMLLTLGAALMASKVRPRRGFGRF